MIFSIGYLLNLKVMFFFSNLKFIILVPETQRETQTRQVIIILTSVFYVWFA